ncbi:MAG: hypothetical protein ISP90_05370 [Nevskia sp.]|nr:hypothetical protein [Nevskia sp.]
MDFEAGLPILVASAVAVVLFTWLQLERRAIAHDLRIYARGYQLPTVTGPVERTFTRVRSVVLWSSLAAPSVMAFSGQLDEHGVALAFNGALQIVAPFASACFSAAVAWLLVISALVVHAAHCRMLELFRHPQGRKDFW